MYVIEAGMCNLDNYKNLKVKWVVVKDKRREIEDILDQIEVCSDTNKLIRLRKELNYAIILFCNKKISDLTETN